MKIKKYVKLFGLIGCLALGSVGCGPQKAEETSVVQTDEVNQVATIEESVEQAPKLPENETVEETMEQEPETVQVDFENLTAEDVDLKVAEIILEQSRSWFTGEECRAEGHLILDYEPAESSVKVYVLMMYGEYQFQNVDYLIKASGTGVIPAVMEFGVKEDGVEFHSLQWPADGSGYEKSIKEMFPEEHWDRTLSIQDEDRAVLEAMELAYAEKHLAMTGRDAVIGEYADVQNRTLLTDHGISVEVSNQMVANEKNIGPYPNWVGSLEKIEDGERYIYTLDVDEEQGQIVYEKRVFGTGEPIEKFVYDAKTGDALNED